MNNKEETMRINNTYKLFVTLSIIIFMINIQAQDKNEDVIKVIYSESLTKSGFILIDFSVKSLYDQWGFLYTYVGFISDKELPDIVVNFFDKKDNIFVQTDDCKKRVLNNEFKNMSYIYYCYLIHIDPSLIKTIVIETQ